MTLTKSRISLAPVVAVLPAESLSRARSFYHDTLGFEVRDMPELGQFVLEAGGGTRILVYERERTRAEHTVAGFVVDDVESMVEELRGLGVVFEDYDLPGLKTVGGIASTPVGKAAWFTDPEGNIISISEML
jgi:catechol-2,3-dioxygenase